MARNSRGLLSGHFLKIYVFPVELSSYRLLAEPIISGNRNNYTHEQACCQTVLISGVSTAVLKLASPSDGPGSAHSARSREWGYCPWHNREPRKTRESNPHRFHPELFSRQSRRANIRLSSWQRRPQVGAFLPSFRPVYGRSSAGSILTPEGSGCGRRSMLHSILSARVAGIEPATSLRQSEALYH